MDPNSPAPTPGPIDLPIPERHNRGFTGAGDDENNAALLRRSWKGKGKATDDPTLSSGPTKDPEPLTLLRLPIDVLRLIFQELSKREDDALLVLVFVNSTLHDLVTPYIHNRFDIVWPAVPSLVDDLSGSYVDALTHGLSVYALGSRFAQTLYRVNGLPPPIGRPPIRTDYARHVRHFSIGNGPSKWVADYHLRTESGKMLNTLTALALQKMTNLESFKWDMPTGVSSDVFMALASLADKPSDSDDHPVAPSHPCSLQEVWIRCHDASMSMATSGSSLPISHPQHGSISSSSQRPWRNALRRRCYFDALIEYPTHSVLPPLRSLSVLEIPSMAHVDEVAILIGRSQPVLRELRLSITAAAMSQGLGRISNKEDKLKQYDADALWPGESRIKDCRLGGVLGAALARIYDMRKNKVHASEPESGDSNPKPPPPAGTASSSSPMARSDGAGPSCAEGGLDTDNAINVHQASLVAASENVARHSSERSGSRPSVANLSDTGAAQTVLPLRFAGQADHTTKRLALERLELSRISLHATLCVEAFDWTVLTSLTILGCNHQEKLWGALRAQFRPTKSKRMSGRGVDRTQSSTDARQYHLRITKLHVDITSYALLNFIKEALAPNTLEQLFLHDRRNAAAPVVPLAEIFSAGIRRHHMSLKKLLLDASPPIGPDGFRSLCWGLTLEMVLYLTSGRMSILQELSACFSQDACWHTFLQRLPVLPNLTALNTPVIGGTIGSPEPGQLGLQIVDIISLRPEVKLCFVGLCNRCFQVVESTHGSSTSSDDSSSSSDDGTSVSSNSDLGHAPVVPTSAQNNEDDEGIVSGDESDNDSFTLREPEVSPVSTKTYRLKEIHFFDKVAIFKARHGTL